MEQIISEAKLLTEHQEKIGSADTINFMKYATARGVQDNAHEFLSIEHGLYKETLVKVSLNQAKADIESRELKQIHVKHSSVKEEISSVEPKSYKSYTDISNKQNHKFNQGGSNQLNVKDMIGKLQDEYLTKINTVRIDSDISNRDLKSAAFESNSDRQELFKVLSRDVAFIHKESTGGQLTATHQELICKTVSEFIAGYKPNLSNRNLNNHDKLDLTDKTAIAEHVHSKVNNKDWWKKLAQENASKVAELKSADSKHIDDLLKSRELSIEYIKMINPKYDEADLRERLALVNNKGNKRYNYINKEMLDNFKDYVQPELDGFSAKKADAKNVGDFIKAYDEELKYHNDIRKDHHEMVKYWNQKDEKNNPFNKHIDALAKPDIAKDLKLISYNMTKYGVHSPDSLLNEFKGSDNLNHTLNDMDERFKTAINNIVGVDCTSLECNYAVNRDGKKFTDKCDYLTHIARPL